MQLQKELEAAKADEKLAQVWFLTADFAAARCRSSGPSWRDEVQVVTAAHCHESDSATCQCHWTVSADHYHQTKP